MYSQSPKIESLMKQGSTRYVEMCLEVGSGLGEECPESRENSMRHVNMVRGTIYRLEGHGRLFISVFLCCSIFL